MLAQSRELLHSFQTKERKPPIESVRHFDTNSTDLTSNFVLPVSRSAIRTNIDDTVTMVARVEQGGVRKHNAGWGYTLHLEYVLTTPQTSRLSLTRFFRLLHRLACLVVNNSVFVEKSTPSAHAEVEPSVELSDLPTHCASNHLSNP
jgi:hypothetical protein